MTLATDKRLGPYEIISPLGAGGMGEVWRARDTRLNREVAIKLLPAGFARDADRLKRFKQEARATSTLNHPNILTCARRPSGHPLPTPTLSCAGPFQQRRAIA
jgi:eukaryotic-like serine/threonine-protein kinase